MIEVLYRNEDVVVCVKPVGLLSQDGGENSMPEQLRRQLSCPYIGVVHRLDREVGGVMVYACSRNAAAELSRQVQERILDKRYLAVLSGECPEPAAVLEDLLFHDRTKNKTYVVNRERKGVKVAKLSYRLLQARQGRSFVQVQLFTGRTHQIRVQFASRKLPLVGDAKYGGKQNGKALGLWSYRLSFRDPASGEAVCFAKLPPDQAPWCEFDMEILDDIHR